MIEVIDLSWNKFRKKGAKELAIGIKVNKLFCFTNWIFWKRDVKFVWHVSPLQHNSAHRNRN